VPLRLIFEPALAQRPRGTRIDGVPAQLDLRADGNRTIAPVQVMLDHARVIDFEA
jgi:hypothetical protein